MLTDFLAYEGSFSYSHRLNIYMGVHGSGRIFRRSDAQVFDAVLHPGRIGFAVPGTEGEGFWENVRLLFLSAELAKLPIGEDGPACGDDFVPAVSHPHDDPLLVYAAGPSFTPEFFGRTSEDVWRDWLEGDVLAAIHLAQESIPHLRQSAAAFLALSIYQGDMIEVRGGVSAISKAAVDRMVAVVAKEEGRANSLRCGCISSETNMRLFQAMPEMAAYKSKGDTVGAAGEAGRNWWNGCFSVFADGRFHHGPDPDGRWR